MRAALFAITLALTTPTTLLAQPQQSDPFLWLEDVSSPKSMAWVTFHNAATTNVLEGDPRYERFYRNALTVALTKDRIPYPRFIGGDVYYLWHDEDHLRGVWQKTSVEDLATAHPLWKTVLDIDALGKTEGKIWVFHGADCIEPNEDRCMISLSDGGGDALEFREFDLKAGAFVPGGFEIPAGKYHIAWEDRDHLLIATGRTPSDITAGGYPFVVKRLARGQTLESAIEVFRGERTDGGYGVVPHILQDRLGHRISILERQIDTLRHETYLLDAASPQRLGIPMKAQVKALVGGRVIIALDEAWKGDADTFPMGSLVQVDLAQLKLNPAHPQPCLIWAPGPKQAFEDIYATGDKFVLSILDNVHPQNWVYKPEAGNRWSKVVLAPPESENDQTTVSALDYNSDRAFLWTTGFLTPPSLWLANTASGLTKRLKQQPSQFDADGDVVEQFTAKAADGARIPYFIVRPKTMKLDGSTPTLLYAYGGFGGNPAPYYDAANGKLWLERGGAYVIANIRGGGEFGPAWHKAAVGTNRQVAFDDFAAVAKDLIARKITSPRRLGIMGTSNGGLLMGVEFVQHPTLWRAVVIGVPLLDMIRISKIAAGQSWQGEYGDVNSDPAAMAFWLRTSPYQTLSPAIQYPEPFIFTTTQDDRVGPQHARKFAARLEQFGRPFLYFENVEGGHGWGADEKQIAQVEALIMTYLTRKLMD